MLTPTSIQTYSILEGKPNVTLTAYIAGQSNEMAFNQKRKALLVIPGGGYHWCSDREGDPVALHFLSQGYNTFVLEYTTAHNADPKWPAPLVDASAAMKFIRDNAEKFHIDPDYVFAIGFSAGGHLAASLATLWDDDEIEKMLGMEKGYNRPTGVILAYPVISGLEYAHRGSFDNILGERKDDEDARRELSLEYRVTEKTAPCFIWSTRPDRTVPIQNSILFAEALANAGVPFEMHVYPMGWHGTSLATPPVGVDFPAISAWSADALRWMNSFK